MEEIIVTILIMLFGAGIPAFLAYKLELNVPLFAIIFIGLTYWVIPDFSFFSIVFYLGILIIMGAIGIANIEQKKEKEKIDKMTVEERKEYIKEKTDDFNASLQKKEHAKIESQTIRCPNCQSINVNFIENQRKGFSVGKAVGGGLLTGGIGTLAGFAGKKGKKDLWHCNDCGFTFERKRK